MFVIDAAAARAFARAGGGNVPLIRSGAATPSITADVAALAANASLPDGCTLKYESGVLSVDVKARTGMAIIFK